MTSKRKLSISQTYEPEGLGLFWSKRPRFTPPMTISEHPPTRDIISTLSDELLVRILSFLGETKLLCIALVSGRFRRLAGDSQLWRTHYYKRFVLPRALRIPGFRVGAGAELGAPRSHAPRLQYSARRAVWADGGWGRRGCLMDLGNESEATPARMVDWKRQYKLRHNWAHGKCNVEEVSVRDGSAESGSQKRTLVKVIEGIAVTVDSTSGLRAWDLRTRQSIAQIELRPVGSDEDDRPISLAVDGQGDSNDVVDVVVGFTDGSFGIWRLDLEKKQLTRRYRHEKSINGELMAVAYGHPYVLTATNGGVISLYTFNRPPTDFPDSDTEEARETTVEERTKITQTNQFEMALPPPYLLTSLESPTTRQPLALSIRRMASSVSASIAYTFPRREGWCIGIQDILIKPSTSGIDTLSSRLAYTLPIKTGGDNSDDDSNNNNNNNSNTPPDDSQTGLTTLCYSHPYLLATLPDNTLILHLCTSTATSLSLSPGIRLWGHTSGISDAEITPRGKAVSISSRGDEIRVWELEGRLGGSSIEVRPRQTMDDADDPCGSLGATSSGHGYGYGVAQSSRLDVPEWEDRRNWVGFDDEMVIVLKEARDGRESLMVYDFT